MRKPTIWVLTRSDTNESGQLQNVARNLKFRIKKVEELYYPYSKNKGADQLRSYCEADLRLCFRLCRLFVFPCGDSNYIPILIFPDKYITVYGQPGSLHLGKQPHHTVTLLYYPCSENKGADQLRSYCEADLRLCFRLCRLFVFPCGDSNYIPILVFPDKYITVYGQPGSLHLGKQPHHTVTLLYYPCSENKGADQLRSYCEADLRLYFRLCRLFVFPCGDSNYIPILIFPDKYITVYGQPGSLYLGKQSHHTVNLHT